MGGEGEEAGALNTYGRPSRAFLLLECLFYIGGLVLILGLAYAAFYRTMGHWQSLSRNSADIVRTLQAGERWRADVRSATAPPHVVEFIQETIFHVPQAQGEILYAFREGAVFRRTPSNLDWLPLLPKVKGFKMQIDQREHVTAWRWEVELQTVQKAAHVKPLFTFQAVTANPGKR